MDNIAGYAAPGFEPVLEAFAENFDDKLELGASFAAYIGDELIVDATGGWADRRRTRAWDARTLAPVYSTTKGVSALVIARVLHENLTTPYERTVASVWPEFGAAGKDKMTIGELLSHQGGLPGFVNEIDPAIWLDPRAVAQKLAAENPMWPPGDGSGYHPLTWGYLVYELCLRLAGRTVGEILRDGITNADGARAGQEQIDFWIGTPASEHDRCADIQRPTSPPELGEINAFRTAAFLTRWSQPDRGGPKWRTAEIPSANGHGNGKSVARLYGIYANQGRLGGRDVLGGPDAFAGLTRRRCLGEDRVLPFTMEFAAGVMRNNNRIYGPNPDTLGHAGWGGSFGFGDPDRRLSAGYVMNRQSNQLQTDARGQRLIGALYGCL